MSIDQAAVTMTGERYRESLDDGRSVWLNGERVGDVAGHPAFSGLVDEMARLYDWQHEPAVSGETMFQAAGGSRASVSYQLPRTVEDLRRKVRNSELRMRESWGQLGRSTDFMANVTVGLYDFREELEANGDGLGRNAERYHRFAMERDLAITHALGDPQVDRSASPIEDPDLALRIVGETDAGLVVRGAKQLATLAPFAHEVIVYLSVSFAPREASEFVSWFALPMNAPGLTILCREPLGDHGHGHGHPFARRYDEQDAMLFFDDVVVPWERVFLLRDGQLALRGMKAINRWSVLTSQVRFHQRLLTFLGVASLMARSIGVEQFRGVTEALGELTSYVELFRMALTGVVENGAPTPGGLFAPADHTALGIWAAQVSSRVVEIVRQIGSSGILMQPSERDLASPELRPYLERYMRGRDIGVEQKSRLFRLAWDIVGSGFAARQELYEWVHRGDIGRNRMNLYRSYDLSDVEGRIRELISRPLPV